jgi:hypothetical protein
VGLHHRGRGSDPDPEFSIPMKIWSFFALAMLFCLATNPIAALIIMAIVGAWYVLILSLFA